MIIKMKPITIVIYTGLLAFTCGKLRAQQEPVFAFYGQQLNIVNPAVAGSAESGLVSLLHRSQWNQLPDGPESTALSFGSHWGKRLGGGFSLWTDQTFVERQTVANIDFSYEVPLSTKHSLYMGLKAGGNFYKVNLNGLETFDAAVDPALVDIDRFMPNFGVGFYLEHERYYISLSSPRILGSKRAIEQDGVYSAATARPHYYLAAGLTVPLNQSWSIRPSLMARKLGNVPLNVEFTGLFDYNGRFSIGAGYRSSGAFTGLALIGITKGWELGYGYDTATNRDFGTVVGASHELLLRVRLGSKTVQATNEGETPPEEEETLEE